MKGQSTEYPEQESGLIYALDIGTRSVIGMLGHLQDGRVQITAIEKQPHARRAMLDGQIEDIAQVALGVREVTARLERRSGRHLTRACVAAAGRALRTETGEDTLTLSAPENIGSELLGRLETAAVAAAERRLQEEQETGQRLFLVGYTVRQYLLDGYPMTSLMNHRGQRLQADVVATFLPGAVIDSLYTVMQQAGLEVASLTLEPIAALNAAIPEDLRLLNLALVDIGAGTSDIAVCRDGSVVGYTMATVAGDEITEAVMRACLVDYPTAEEIKAALALDQPVSYTDILGLAQTADPAELRRQIEGAVQGLVQELSGRITELNGGPPSAVFLAGGGSKLANLCDLLADALKMDRRRVATAGAYFKNGAFSEQEDLNDPEYTTPLGIAISAGLGLISDSCQIRLNGRPAKLFRSGSLTAMELLMMNGYTYEDLVGRSGRPLSLYVGGKRTVFYGTPSVPAELTLNGAAVPAAAVVRAGDQLQFTPAKPGQDARVTAGELASARRAVKIWVNGKSVPPETALRQGDRVELLEATQTKDAPPPADPAPPQAPVHVRFNGEALTLPAKSDGQPYYLMDLLERSGIDFQHLDRPVRLRVNGQPGLFQQILREEDEVEILCEPE